MKITVLGSGSIFFTRQIVKTLIESPRTTRVELALVDTHEHKCEQMGMFAERAFEEAGVDIPVTYTSDRTEALPGSDYVILTFSTRNAHNRGVGVHVCGNYGIREASGDTAGPAGCVFRTMQAVPAILAAARDIERLCPDAWVLNYVNPTNIVGAVLDRSTNLKAYAFCDGMYTPAEGTIEDSLGVRVDRYAGTNDPSGRAFADRFDVSVGGINHFVWMTGLTADGEDLWPRFMDGLKKAAREDGACSRTHAEWQLAEVFNAYPTVIGHSMEYVRYFQGRGRRPETDFVITPWDLNARIRWTRKVWREIAACNAGTARPSGILSGLRTEMLMHIIESMERDLNLRFPVNVRNDGRIPNLPDEVLIETFGSFGRDGAFVPHVGELPRGLLGLTHQVIDYQELCLEAAMSAGDYNKVVKAVASDPLVMSLNDAKSIAYDLMAVVEEELPDVWDTYWATPQYEDRFFLSV